MKRLPSLVIFIFIFISAAVFSAHGAEVKIGILDTQKIIMQSEKISKYRADINRELEAKSQELLKKQNSAKMLESELKAEGSTMTDQVRREKYDQYQQEAKEFSRMQEEFKAEMQSRESEMLRKFQRQVKEVADEFLKNEKYTLILEKSIAVSFDDAVDITDQVIKLYDSKP